MSVSNNTEVSVIISNCILICCGVCIAKFQSCIVGLAIGNYYNSQTLLAEIVCYSFQTLRNSFARNCLITFFYREARVN